MNRFVDGKWVTTRTEAEIQKEFEADWAKLTPEERIALQTMMQEIQGDGPRLQGPTLVQAVEQLEFNRIPVDPITFLEDPYYLGEVGIGMFPKLKQHFINLFSGNYEELIMTGSIGYGKSFFATCVLTYVIYQMTCLRNAAETYGLASGSQLHIANLSARKDTAQRVVFEGISDKLGLSPYFKEIGMEQRKDELRFPGNIIVLGGESTDSSILGLNVVSAFVDETNFLRGQVSKANKARHHFYSRAEQLYNALKARMQSRFLSRGNMPGLLILVSSRVAPDDFTEQRIRQAADDPKVYVMDLALWDVKPDSYSKERFKVYVGVGGQKPRILEPNELVELKDGERLVDVPIDFRRRFDDDLNGSLRDLAGVSVVTISTFLQSRDKIFGIVDKKRKHPFTTDEWDPSLDGRFDWSKLVRKNEQGEMEPIHHPNAIRYAAIDPSLSGDATGVAVGCVAGFRKVVREDKEGKKYEEDSPLIWVDFVLRIVPPKGGEINFGDVRNLIYQLSDRGFPIHKVCLDSFQSADSLQQYRLKGYQAELLSVDTSMAPYQLLKGTIYEGRLSVYEYPVLLEELKRLEIDWERRKVDHPADFSKDVSDAVCALTYSLSQKFTKGGSQISGVEPMMGLTDGDKEREQQYIPVDSKHKKAGDIIWGDDEEEERYWREEEGRSKDQVRDDDDTQVPPFLT